MYGKFVPTIEQVQQAVKKLPPPQAIVNGAVWYVALALPFNPSPMWAFPDNWLHLQDATHHSRLAFRLYRHVDEYGRVWHRWQHEGPVLV